MNIIETNQLTKRYSGRNRGPTGAHPALDALTLEIAPAQFFGLIGPDGAGKTTALRILSTVLLPTSGSARVSGLDVRSQAEQVRKLIGYMPQAFSLYPDLSVLENLEFFADIHHLSREKKKERMAFMLEFTRLENFIHSRASVLSGGMKKKLALACAMIHEPQILLLDEPSTGVDPISRRELWEILARVVQRGVTVVVSTPYMDEAERCHQIAILYEGTLLTSGSPRGLQKDLPFQILEVNARPRKDMRRIAAATENLLEWRPVGDRLRLAIPAGAPAAQTTLHSLDERMRQENLDVKSLHLTRSTLEDVFVYLVNRKRGK
ncbi:MAG TPA: ABC transporter ATP-binding protein [Anaerolineaceae bacterium]|nr:ABC transporter ATP-binding protein [Anaerolineaceae bacterium]